MDIYRKKFLKAQGIAENVVHTDKNHFLRSILAEDVRIEETSVFSMDLEKAAGQIQHSKISCLNARLLVPDGMGVSIPIMGF